MEYLASIQSLLEEQSAYGYVCESGVYQYGHLPHIAPEAYSVYTFAPLTKEQLSLLKARLGMELPEAYAAFLSEVSNGMHLFHRCLSLYGLQGKLDRRSGVLGPFDLDIPNCYERPRNADEDCFFIGGYSYDVSQLYMRRGGEQVYYCARRDATPLRQWSSFSVMLTEEIQRLRSIHDPRGVLQVERQKTLPI
ncbi:SMI1/KNR4 family protein [Porphyromonas sp.]